MRDITKRCSVFFVRVVLNVLLWGLFACARDNAGVADRATCDVGFVLSAGLCSQMCVDKTDCGAYANCVNGVCIATQVLGRDPAAMATAVVSCGDFCQLDVHVNDDEAYVHGNFFPLSIRNI